jgi:adenosylhomocysteine nucleosidase
MEKGGARVRARRLSGVRRRATVAAMTLAPWCAHHAGFVTGLLAEARIAAPLGPAEAGGGLPPGARAAAERLLARGVTALVSFGLCGGLDPMVRPGALIVPRAVLSAGRRYDTDATLSAALGGRSAEALLAGEAAAAEPASKRRLFEATGAAAIDLESGAVAEVAAGTGLPFAVLRAVCDAAEATLPPAALAALDPRGGVSVWAVTGSLLREPAQLPALIALGRAATAARAALVRRVGDIRDGRFLVP